MSTLYLVFGVPHKSKKQFLRQPPVGMFTLAEENISFEEEREIVKKLLNEDKDILVDIYNAMPSIFESWFEFIDNLNHEIKIITISTPLDIIMNETDLDPDDMQPIYNNFVTTMGWLYADHGEKIINSAHLQ